MHDSINNNIYIYIYNINFNVKYNLQKYNILIVVY